MQRNLYNVTRTNAEGTKLEARGGVFTCNTVSPSPCNISVEFALSPTFSNMT